MKEKSAYTRALSLWFLILRFFIFIKTVYILTMTLLRCTIHLVNKRDLEFKNKNCEEKMSTLSVVVYIYQNSLHPYYDIIKINHI